MRYLPVVVVVAALAIPFALLAQEGGVTADGWEARLDRDGDAAGVLSFMSMGTGVHAMTAGRGAAIFWKPDSMAKADYTISAAFTQAEPSGHPNGYGLFFGGSDLSGANQRYSYFVIRQGGEFLVTKRMGSETSAVIDWTAHDAINDLDDQGKSTNTLAVEVGSNQVRFLVNGTEVATQPRSAVDTDGITGLRVNHLLNVDIDSLMLGM